MFEIGNKVKVLVNGKYKLIGEITNIENDIATVYIETYYRDGFIKVKSNVNDLQRIRGGIKSCKGHKIEYYYND